MLPHLPLSAIDGFCVTPGCSPAAAAAAVALPCPHVPSLAAVLGHWDGHNPWQRGTRGVGCTSTSLGGLGKGAAEGGAGLSPVSALLAQ